MNVLRLCEQKTFRSVSGLNAKKDIQFPYTFQCKQCIEFGDDDFDLSWLAASDEDIIHAYENIHGV